MTTTMIDEYDLFDEYIRNYNRNYNRSREVTSYVIESFGNVSSKQKWIATVLLGRYTPDPTPKVYTANSLEKLLNTLHTEGYMGSSSHAWKAVIPEHTYMGFTGIQTDHEWRWGEWHARWRLKGGEEVLILSAESMDSILRGFVLDALYLSDYDESKLGDEIGRAHV